MTPDTLRGLRRRLNWSQTQLAEALGVKRGAIARWERGDKIDKRTTMALEHLDCGKGPEMLDEPSEVNVARMEAE